MSLRRRIAQALTQRATRAPVQGDLFPETAPKALRAFHGTRSEFKDFAPLSHFGTERAAKDRVNNIEGEIFRRNANGRARIIPVEISGKRISVGDEFDTKFTDEAGDTADLLLRGRHITPEEHRYILEPMEEGRTRYLGRDASEVARERLQEVAGRNDIGAIGYRNAVEDAGSTSYIVPNPANVRRTGNANPISSVRRA